MINLSIGTPSTYMSTIPLRMVYDKLIYFLSVLTYEPHFGYRGR